MSNFKNRRISVGIDRVINLGNYESIRLHVGFDAGISDTDNLEECYKKAWETAETQLDLEIKSLGLDDSEQ